MLLGENQVDAMGISLVEVASVVVALGRLQHMQEPQNSLLDLVPVQHQLLLLLEGMELAGQAIVEVGTHLVIDTVHHSQKLCQCLQSLCQ